MLALIGAVASQTYVWDLLKPALNAAEVATILANRDYPVINGAGVPDNAQNYDCNGKTGFYADTKFNCQVFHRCDVNGNLTSFVCVNSSVFNQITLTCDYWFNVDCAKFAQYESFANSRLYNPDQPLFDTPPANYVIRQARQVSDAPTSAPVAATSAASVAAADTTTAAAAAATTAAAAATTGASVAASSDAATTAAAAATTGASVAASSDAATTAAAVAATSAAGTTAAAAAKA